MYDYEWRLDDLRQFFGRYRLCEIDAALVDRVPALLLGELTRLAGCLAMP